MIVKLIVLVFMYVSLSEASTRIRANNYCRTSIIPNAKADGITLPMCKLNPGFSCYIDLDTTKVLEIFDGYDVDQYAYAKLSINAAGSDQYYIMTDRGFDHDLQIQSERDDAPLLTCRTDKNCPGAYNNNGSKTGIVTTGGIININFCPFNDDEKAPTLPLVESIQHPEQYKVKQPIRAHKRLIKAFQNKL